MSGIVLAHPASPLYATLRPSPLASSLDHHASPDSKDTKGALEPAMQDDAPFAERFPGGEETLFCSPLHAAQERATVRTYMLTHSVRGNKLPKTRQPFVGELTSLVSPIDPEVVFQIKRLNNRAILAYRDANSHVRYIMGEGDDSVTTERDFPMGSTRKQVVLLGLDSWNLTDANSAPLLITEETVLSYLDPEELDAVYEKVMEVNPVLSGQTARKNS